MNNDITYQWASLFLLVIIITTILVVFPDFGITWDEQVQHQYGQYIIDYYQTGFTDKNALTYKNLYLYGGFFDSVAVLLASLGLQETYATRHLWNALIGFIGIIGTLKLANLVAGPRVAFLATLLLFLEPFYFGNMFNNPKDIPFAAGYVWSLYYLLSALRYFPVIPRRIVIKLGIAIGLTLSVRVGGLLLYGYLLLAVVCYTYWPQYLADNETKQSRPTHWYWPLLRSITGVVLLSYTIMLIFWPWAQQAPFSRPFEALGALSQFDWQGDVLFQGISISAKSLPSHYLTQYLFIKMPEIMVISIVLGMFMLLWSIHKRRFSPNKVKLGFYTALLIALVFPIIYTAMSNAVLYDSIRHFLFVIPLLCIFSAVIIDHLLIPAKPGSARKPYTFFTITVVLVLPQIYANVQLHPYQYVYYNSFVGGVQGAAGRYELDYWANSYGEAVKKLIAYLHQRDGNNFAGKIYKIHVCLPVFPAQHYFSPNFRLEKNLDKADYYISFTHWNCHLKGQGEEIIAVVRGGVKLSIIKRIN